MTRCLLVDMRPPSWVGVFLWSLAPLLARRLPRQSWCRRRGCTVSRRAACCSAAHCAVLFLTFSLGLCFVRALCFRLAHLARLTRLGKRLVDETRDFDALLHAFVLHEGQDRRE